eukprot:m.179372 g.179372  ORF g.179372 m.179372 type:complete len:76 (-) comp17990_c0_seq8:274-501(-)
MASLTRQVLTSTIELADAAVLSASSAWSPTVDGFPTMGKRELLCSVLEVIASNRNLQRLVEMYQQLLESCHKPGF